MQKIVVLICIILAEGLLIRKLKVSNVVIEYYNRMNNIDMLMNVDFHIRNEYRNAATHIFHPILFDGMINAENDVIRLQGNPQLISYDKEKLMSLAGIVGYLKSTRIGIARACTSMNDAANEFTILIKQEYHLK